MCWLYGLKRTNAAHYNEDTIQKGIKVELEHTEEWDILREHKARCIVMHHLEEDPNYYEYLDEMEKKFRKKPTIPQLTAQIAPSINLFEPNREFE